MSNSGTHPHILVFPFPAQGHMIPLLDLSSQLCTRDLTITILITPQNLPILNPLLSKHPTIQTLILPFPAHPSIPNGIKNVKDLPFHLFPQILHSMKQLYSPILQWFQAHPSPPTAILSDLFLGWTHHLASELRIPRIIFSPSGALAVSLAHFLWRDLPKREDPNNPNFPISFLKVPNSPVFPWCHLSFLFREYMEGDTYLQIVRDDWLANLASWGLVVNSFSELEGVYLDHLKKDMGHDRVWAVGPLSPLEVTERGGSSSIPTHELMNWLDTCGDHSVVYICFGSQAILSNKQMEELAAGLEASDARFIWCVKEVKGENGYAEFGMVPTGFTDRVVGKGLVIRGWVPQVEILRHKSLGVFLTHCGWNSVLEGLVAGVPMIAWPMGADQFINARLLVEEMGVAVKVCEGEDSIPNSEDVARVVVESLGENWPIRVRAKELSVAALGAIKEGTGSSTKDLDGLVKELCMLN